MFSNEINASSLWRSAWRRSFAQNSPGIRTQIGTFLTRAGSRLVRMHSAWGRIWASEGHWHAAQTAAANQRSTWSVFEISLRSRVVFQ
jgi:hypothetical protein